MTTSRIKREENGSNHPDRDSVPNDDDVVPESTTSSGGGNADSHPDHHPTTVRRSNRIMNARTGNNDIPEACGSQRYASPRPVRTRRASNDHNHNSSMVTPDRPVSAAGQERDDVVEEEEVSPHPVFSGTTMAAVEEDEEEEPERKRRRRGSDDAHDNGNSDLPPAMAADEEQQPNSNYHDEEEPQTNASVPQAVPSSRSNPQQHQQQQQQQQVQQHRYHQNQQQHHQQPTFHYDGGLSLDEQIMGPGIIGAETLDGWDPTSTAGNTAGIIDYGSYGGQSQERVTVIARSVPNNNNNNNNTDGGGVPETTTTTVTPTTTTTMHPPNYPTMMNPTTMHQHPPTMMMHPWGYYGNPVYQHAPWMTTPGRPSRSQETAAFVAAAPPPPTTYYWPVPPNNTIHTTPIPAPQGIGGATHQQHHHHHHHQQQQQQQQRQTWTDAHHASHQNVHTVVGSPANNDSPPVTDPIPTTAVSADPASPVVVPPAATPTAVVSAESATPLVVEATANPTLEEPGSSVLVPAEPTTGPLVEEVDVEQDPSSGRTGDTITVTGDTDSSTANVATNVQVNPPGESEIPDKPTSSSEEEEEEPKLPVVKVERTGVSLGATQLKQSIGRTRDILNQHLAKLGLSAKFGMTVIAKKGLKISHLTFNDQWNDLPRTEQERLQFWLGHGAGRLRLALPLDPAKQSQEPVPIFWAVAQKERGGASCHYVGHFKSVKFEINNEHTVLFKRHDRQALIEFEFTRFDSDLAAKIAAIDPVQTLADIAVIAAAKAAAKEAAAAAAAAAAATSSNDDVASSGVADSIAGQLPTPPVISPTRNIIHLTAMPMNNGTSTPITTHQLPQESLYQASDPCPLNVREATMIVSPISTTYNESETVTGDPPSTEPEKKQSKKRNNGSTRQRASLVKPLAAGLLLITCHTCSAFFLPSPTRPVMHHKDQTQMAMLDTDLTATDNALPDDIFGSLGEHPLSRSSFFSTSCMAALAVTTAAVSPEQAQAATLSSLAAQPTIASSSSSTSSASSSNSQTTLEESISGFLAGAALSTTKTVVKYPLDTATVRLQMPASQYSIFYEPWKLLNGSFRGIATPLVSNIPAGAVFFAVKDATKQYLKSSAGDLPRWASTSLAVLAATFPYMAIRNPSEVIKTRLRKCAL